MSNLGFTVKAQIIGSAEVQAKLAQAGQTVHAAVYKAVQEMGFRLLAHVKQDKLSDQVLHVRTGRLRRSINMQMSDTAAGIFASVGTNVVYARIHEFGGTTSPHDIVARNAQALHFIMDGRDVFVKKVHHPGSKMPERSFLRSSLADMRGEILERIQAALNQAVAGE